MGFLSLFLSVLLLNLFAYITIRIRPFIYKTNLYKPMIWNIKLSIMPFVILVGNTILAIILSYIGTYFELSFMYVIRTIIFILGLVVWLLALPNSGYLVTELNLSHREADKVEVPIWYDIISMLAFALSGVVNTLANIVILQVVYLVVYDPASLTQENQVYLLLTALTIICLVSVGIYLGRSIRFNSWDIIHIKSFFKKLYDHFKQKGVIKDACLFIFFHTIFFMILYVSFGIPLYFVG